MRESFIDLLAERVNRCEAGIIPDSWRRKFRHALIPVLLMYGCGTQGTKDDKGDDNQESSQEDEGGEAVAPIPPSTTTPKVGTAFNPKGIDQQLQERGWGCSVTLTRPTSMTWRFTRLFPEDRGVRRNRDEFSIVFWRGSENDPWDFSKPRMVSETATPEMESLQQEVLDAMAYGAKYIATKYDCQVGNPTGTNID